jgi:hypothetical protein
MTCHQVQDYLAENLTSDGLEMTPETKAHLDACADCAAFYREMQSLTSELAPAGEFCLSEVESARMHRGLAEKINLTRRTEDRAARRKILALAPMALAVAAMVVLVIWQPWQKTVIGPTLSASEELQIEHLRADDIIPMFSNSDAELLPSVVDTSTATYLTGQVKPGQADDILDSLSADELKWLEKNLAMEM